VALNVISNAVETSMAETTLLDFKSNIVVTSSRRRRKNRAAVIVARNNDGDLDATSGAA
jgi:hypothetical protein